LINSDFKEWGRIDFL